MKKIIKFLIPLFVFVILAMPVLSLAKPIVPCTNVGDDKCDFNAFMTLINNVIDFAILKMALPIAAIMFAYAGFLMVTAGEESASAKTKAKGIFMNALTGLALAVASWLIVNTLLSVMGYDGTWLGFKKVLQ